MSRTTRPLERTTRNKTLIEKLVAMYGSSPNPPPPPDIQAIWAKGRKAEAARLAKEASLRAAKLGFTINAEAWAEAWLDNEELERSLQRRRNGYDTRPYPW